jgi:hypothetical protein
VEPSVVVVQTDDVHDLIVGAGRTIWVPRADDVEVPSPPVEHGETLGFRDVQEVRPGGVGGHPWTGDGFGTFWRRIRDAFGVEGAQLYDLRRHACAQLAARVVSQVAITFSGHPNPVTVSKIYAFAIQGSAEFAAETVTWSPPALRDASGDGRRDGEI